MTAWNDLSTERPVIATMASVSFGAIPLSKIKSYAMDDLGLAGDEVELFVAVIRRVEIKSRASNTADPEMTDQARAGDTQGVKRIVSGLAKRNAINKRVRHPRP